MGAVSFWSQEGIKEWQDQLFPDKYHQSQCALELEGCSKEGRAAGSTSGAVQTLGS